MTVKPAIAKTHALQKMSNDPASHRNSQYYRALDRALATRYMAIVLEQRRRAAAVRAGNPVDPMRPRMEICDEPDSHLVTAVFELPGLRKEEIGVHLTKEGRLTISGDRRAPPLLNNADPSLPRYPVRELKYGKFERTVDIPAGLEVKDITASLSDGMLSISWPRVGPTPPPPSASSVGHSSSSPYPEAGPSTIAQS